MFKVFLVEDEIVVRESIRENVPWAETRFALAGEASDGEMALPLIEEIQPDILVTDIKMPFMDGLELGRLVRKSMPWVKIVIISGYDEFSLAKEAISLAVADYLLKPLSSEDLLAALERVARQIEEESRERQEVESLSECLKDSRQVMAERFLSDLTTGLVPSGEAIERAKTLGIELMGRNYIVSVITPAVSQGVDSHRQYAEYLKVERLLDELIRDTGDVLKFSHNLTEFTLIFKGEDPQELEHHCYSVVRSLKYEIERKSDCTLSIHVGSVRERIHGIAESFVDAQTANRFSYIFGKNRIVGISDTQRVNFNTGDLLALDSSGIIAALRTEERAAIQERLAEFLRNLRGRDLSAFYRGFAVFDVVLALAKFVEELGGEIDRVLPELSELEQVLSNGEAEALDVCLRRVLEAAYEFREACKSNKYGDLISRARQYIVDNFSDPQVSLNAVARVVSVSPSHFSTIFSQETGQTFIEFLTETRIRRAKELLKSSSLRSSEIAYQIGYKDPHYFSFVFKSRTGVTPTEFRHGKA